MILLTILSILFSGTTYYISSSQGQDSNSGTSPEQAWETLLKVNETTFLPGDRILFRAGDEFIGQLIVSSSGAEGAPIIFGRYGDGPKPIINSAPTPGGSYIASLIIRNQSFIELEDLEVTNDRQVTRPGQNSQQGYGIYVHNNGTQIMQHFHFRNLTVREVYAITTEGVDFDALQVAGIYFRSERNTSNSNVKHIRDIIVEDSFITLTGKFGIWTQHAGGASGVGNDSLNRNMNLIFRNNHTYNTGGSGITPGRSYNVLMEGNTFEFPGSGVDPRMANRGSGAWFFSGRNIIAQHNKVISARGPADTYSIHIDHSNENVFVQFNYSEDSEGGFAEILGDNINSVYRYNVSVNDGFRPNARSLWVSDYAGPNSNVRSDKNYIYNNTVYVSQSRTPGILFRGESTYIYNNILFAAAGSSIGQSEYVVDISAGSEFIVSNNLYQGNIRQNFISTDPNAVVGNPLFVNPGGFNAESYKLQPGSPALNAGIAFEQPVFPSAGFGIFENIPAYPETDMFGNPIDWVNGSVTIGAFAGNEDMENQVIKTGMLLNQDAEPVIDKDIFLYNSGSILTSTKTNSEGFFSLVHDPVEETLRIEIETSQGHQHKILDGIDGSQTLNFDTLTLEWLPGDVTDIDGNTYRTIQIGTQIWMAEHLRTSKYRNGNAIPNVQENADWGALATGAWVIHNNDDPDSPKGINRGKLYNWYAVNDERGVCPEGWMVPEDDDFKELEQYLGMPVNDLDLTNFTRGSVQSVGSRLRSTGAGGDFFWSGENGAAMNTSGFSVRGTSLRFAGGAFPGDNAFEGIDRYGGLWTSTSVSATTAYRRVVHVTESGVNRNAVNKRVGLAVRCFKMADGTSTPGHLDELPNQLGLSQNYPNPFNPTTNIQFNIPEFSHVRLSVFDMLGRSVAVLVDETRTQGNYLISWDASKMASGAYLYRLEAGGKVLTKLMTLIK